ncbi:MAG: FAD-binding protein [Faecalibacterium sp.]
MRLGGRPLPGRPHWRPSSATTSWPRPAPTTTSVSPQAGCSLLENAPYYACQWGTTAMLVCVGGLESDENCHTFTEEDPASPKRDIIKGLYVCGNVQGSRYAVEYPICMRGISHSLCVYYGYIAGKNCVAGV